MSHRFYTSEVPRNGQAVLDGPEAHHLLHVMRATVGGEVTLFDGQGGEYPARITGCHRQRVELEVGPREEVGRELPWRLVLGVALPKGDRQRVLVEKLTELGAAVLVPITTERSIVELRGKSHARLVRGVVEACKQCGRNRLMHIAPTQTLDQFLASAEGTRLVADPAGQPLASVPLAQGEPVTGLIGPEGGLTTAELAQAVEHNWQPVRLAPAVLRVETAAVALAAAIAAQP